MNWIRQYEEDVAGMEKGKKIGALGKKEREEFLSRYPMESISDLTIEQYIIGNTDSFSHWLRYKLRNVTSMGNARPDIFGVYTTEDTGMQIKLSRSYQKFGSVEEAFESIKKDMVNFLNDIKQENYGTWGRYKINSQVKGMLISVYFYDRFLPVCTKPAIDDCLVRVGISIGENATMIEKNLSVVEWKNTVPKLADWPNQMVLDFCRWLQAKNVTTNKDELSQEIVIEETQKIEEEMASLNVEGESRKAIVSVRVNQGMFRNLLLKRYNKCCLCGVENHTLLMASHIKPWAESESKEKLDVNNGFLMCPNHDRLFDKGYITFDDDGKIIISGKLKETDRAYLNVDSRMHIELTDGNKKYLKFHRENVFNK